MSFLQKSQEALHHRTVTVRSPYVHRLSTGIDGVPIGDTDTPKELATEMILLKMNYLKDCTVFQVIIFNNPRKTHRVCSDFSS